jgi:hypothetical protein
VVGIVGGIWVGDVIKEFIELVQVGLGEAKTQGQDGGRIVSADERPSWGKVMALLVDSIGPKKRFCRGQ